MPNRIPRTLTRATFHLALLGGAAGWQGCAPTKTVTLRTTPDRATLLAYKVKPGGGESPLPLDGSADKSPAQVTLDFTGDVHYRVEAHRVLCAPSTDTQVRLEPQAQAAYDIALTQFKQFVTGLGYAAQKVGDIWQLRPAQAQTTATVDVTEPNLLFVDQPVPVTDNKKADVDFAAFAVSSTPAGTLMVYEQVEPNSNIPGGFDSRLFKLPLTPGENPTQLTTNRKQQHDPAFSYTGDSILFDSNDDSRTESPSEFKTATNQSSTTHLEHDADTCQVGFSAGRDALAFTAYSPNAAGPTVQVSGRDGAGPTVRAAGMSPQVSPDGNRVVYVHRPEGGGHYRLSTVNVRGPITTSDLSLDTDHDALDPHWSPDGRLIAYCSDLRDGQPVDLGREPDARFREPDQTHSFLWLVSADGRHPIQLTHNESYDSDPVFDPNGRTVYFRSNRGGQWNIWKCNLSDAAMAAVK